MIETIKFVTYHTFKNEGKSILINQAQGFLGASAVNLLSISNINPYTCALGLAVGRICGGVLKRFIYETPLGSCIDASVDKCVNAPLNREIKNSIGTTLWGAGAVLTYYAALKFVTFSSPTLIALNLTISFIAYRCLSK